VKVIQARPAVGAIIVHPSGRVLLVKRGHAPFLGEWTILGGKVRPGESEAECAVRECREETALDVEVVASLGVVDLEGEGYAYRVHELVCMPRDRDAAPEAGDDAAAVRWARLDELEGLGVRAAAKHWIERGVALLRERGRLDP
jgi:8-oxo-dGTP diphosphatase